jgi:cytochrome b
MTTSETLVSKVWDLPVRLFHWLLVGLLGFSWWSGDRHEMDWHRLSGYGVVALIIFRIYWGFFGGRTARFSHFVRGPRAVLAYGSSLRTGPHPALPGHNPAGGWSVILLLTTLTVMVTSGLLSVDVDGLESGPLSDYVSFEQGRRASEIHHWTFNLLLALVAVHVFAILLYLVRLRHDLITPMIHGSRRIEIRHQIERLGGSTRAAALGLLIAGALTYAIARGFRF